MEINKILIPIGGSVYSQTALQYGLMLAKKFKAELTGIYVQDIRFFEGPWGTSLEGHLIQEPYFNLKEGIAHSFETRGKKIENYFISTCRKEGVPCKFETLKGSVSDSIVSHSEGADLVIMGKRGEHAQWLMRHLGSVCTRVLHHITKPLLVVDNVQPKEVKKVLLSYAGGHYAQKTLELTTYVIRKGGFDLSVLTIATKKTKAIQVQREVKQYFSKENIKAHYLLTIGDVGEEIKKVIKMEDIDLLITGASLHKHYEDFVSFSLTDKILHESSIPVLFVR